jgi:hypothetical protein
MLNAVAPFMLSEKYSVTEWLKIEAVNENQKFINQTIYKMIFLDTDYLINMFTFRN